MKRLYVFELYFTWKGFYGNWLAFLPSLYLIISSCPTMSLNWLGFEFVIRIGIIKNLGKCFFIIPTIRFYHLSNKLKEKYDFQFSWLGINYRKFFGERKEYETTIEESIKNYKADNNNKLLKFLFSYFACTLNKDENKEEQHG